MTNRGLAGPVVCADFGSTFTKLAVVDPASGAILARAEHRTTVDTDVLDGFRAAAAELAATLPDADLSDVLACSSAGGGLRLAVVGYERVISAEAGHRVALSAGGRVVHVAAGWLDGAAVNGLRAAAPDVVLLVGGTDGGDADVVLHNAAALAAAGLGVPVVVAGNAAAAPDAGRLLHAAGVTAIRTANVLPEIGVLDPMPARKAIREVFIRNVIGGKHLSAGPAFAAMVRAATPDAVLAGVEVLADVVGAGLVVVDIGGATTDVYSVVVPDPEDAGLQRAAVEPLWRSRTVEGDLGMRWSAPGVIDAALSERLLAADASGPLRAAAAARAEDPGWLPGSPEEAAVELRLATLAATVALRRHARGRDLRQVALVVGSGGVLRHAPAAESESVIAAVLDDRAGGWKRPEHAALSVDRDYVLAAAGLLSFADPAAAARLLAPSLHLPARPRRSLAPLEDHEEQNDQPDDRHHGRRREDATGLHR